MRKRSFIRGFAAGIVVKVLCTVVFTLVLAGIVHIGGAVQEDGLLRDGRFPAFSGAWFALALLWLAWSAVKVDTGQAVSAVALRVSVSSVGILLGAFVYQRWGRASEA